MYSKLSSFKFPLIQLTYFFTFHFIIWSFCKLTCMVHFVTRVIALKKGYGEVHVQQETELLVIWI